MDRPTLYGSTGFLYFQAECEPCKVWVNVSYLLDWQPGIKNAYIILISEHDCVSYYINNLGMQIDFKAIGDLNLI